MSSERAEMSINNRMRVAVAGALTASVLGSGLALAPSADAAVSSTTSTKAYKYAKDQVGEAYAKSGQSTTGPSTWDCSGLVWKSYKVAGKNWERYNAHDQRRYQTVDIRASQRREGDLIFFRPNGSSYYTHVGIYSGHGKMINAVTGSRDRVVNDLVKDGYWNRYYVADYRRVK